MFHKYGGHAPQVSDPLAQICSHSGLIPRFGHLAQPPNCPIKVQTTEAIIESCCEAWNWMLAETGRIGSLRSYPWLEQVSN